MSRRLNLALLTVSLVGGLGIVAEAQFGGGRGGRGIRGGFGEPQLLTELRRESVQEELGLTADQIAEIEQLAADQPDAAIDFTAIITRMRDAEADEERAAIQAEMQSLRAEREAALREGVGGILSAEQMQRLDQILWHRSGPAALSEDSVAEELQLTEDQRAMIEQLAADRQAAVRGGGFRMSREEREEIQREFDQRILGVLEEDQLVAWTLMLGPEPPEIEEEAPGRRPGRDGGPAVVASDDDSGDDAASSFAPPEGADDEAMAFRFRFAPWEDVLREFAERAGLTLDLNAVPPGTFNYVDSRSHTPTEALDVLNGYLLPKGYALLRRDDFLVCVNIDEGIPPNLIPYVSASELQDRGRNEILTVVFPVRGAEIDTLAEQVQEMLGPQGKAVGIQAAESLVVTDIGVNLRRVHELLQPLAMRTGPGNITLKAYPLEHVPAGEAETMVRALLGIQVGVTNVSRAAQEIRGGFDDRRRWGGGGEGNRDWSGGANSEEDASPLDADLLAQTNVTVNRRTNHLLVMAPDVVHALIDEAIESIDVPADGPFPFGGTEPYLQVYKMQVAEADEVAKTLDVLVPGVVVNEDGRHELLHVYATAEQHRQVLDYLRDLDGGSGGTQSVAVIPLTAMDAMAAASTVQAMFAADGTDAPTVQADVLGRRLMVRGTSDQLAQVRTLLTELGEDGTGQRAAQAGGPVRRVPLSSRDAGRLLDILRQAWRASGANPIQIIPPADRNPIRDIRTPRSREELLPGEPVEAESQPQASPTGDTTTRTQRDVNSPSPAPQFVLTTLQSQDESDDGDGATDEAPAPSETDADAAGGEASDGEEMPEIYLRVEGDNLLLMSEDEEALDRLMVLLEELIASLPPQTGWTVFTLRSADATEVAAMLELLIADTTVSQTSSGTTSLFSSLGLGSSLASGGVDASLSATGTLQIIPEPRLNALFVSGPASKIAEVEQFLEVLDAADTYGDRQPRMIAVQHADVRDVHRVVSDVYSDYLNAGQAAVGGGDGGRESIFAMMMAGQQNGAQEARLTLGLDEQTSHLIVSADEALYQQIRELVESIDAAARDARRTVRVVSLQNTNSSVVQNTLSSLMPRVQVSTAGAGSQRQSGASQSSGGDNRGGGGGPDADQVRRFFEQRMRERMMQQRQQQQGGSGGGAAGRGFGGRGGFGRGRFGRGGDDD